MNLAPRLLLFVVVLLKYADSKNCTKIEDCGPLFRKPPSCHSNKTDEAIQCMKKSCESDNVAIRQIIEVHKYVSELVCSEDKISEAFQTKDICWLTAVTCARGHIIGDKADPSPEVCYMRKHGIDQCKNMAGPTCSEALDEFFSALYSKSKCGANCITVHVIAVALTTFISLARNHL